MDFWPIRHSLFFIALGEIALIRNYGIQRRPSWIFSGFPRIYPSTLRLISVSLDPGIPVFSEIELASWFCRGKIIAVTGSNGKTTTTTLIGAILDAARIGNVVCGNIGNAFSDSVMDVPADGFAVVEVSSFQLDLIEEFAPHVALILNITPDHLDRYEGFDKYKESKFRIAESQSGSGCTQDRCCSRREGGCGHPARPARKQDENAGTEQSCRQQ